MTKQESSGKQVLAEIDQLFIDHVGPIGQILIDEIKDIWRAKQWRGPSALRNYIRALSANIDSPSEKEAFIKQTSQLILEASANKK